MRSRKIEDRIVDAACGQLGSDEEQALMARILEDDAAHVVYAEYRLLMKLQGMLAAEEGELDRDLTSAVMAEIRKEEETPWCASMVSRLAAARAVSAAIGVVALLCTVTWYFQGEPSGSSVSVVGGGSYLGAGPSGSFSEAAYEDKLVRSSVGTLFAAIEGAFGALVAIGFLLLGVGCSVWRLRTGKPSRWVCAVFLGLFVAVMILRALVSSLFGEVGY